MTLTQLGNLIAAHKTEWQYDGKLRTRIDEHGRRQVQRRECVAENSYQNLIRKARSGEYDLDDIQIIGTGNTYLVVGWK